MLMAGRINFGREHLGRLHGTRRASIDLDSHAAVQGGA